MSDTNIIREFLVALGYRNDEAGLKKFEDGIEKATKSVVKLATAVTATVVAVSVGVTKMASNLEALYFASIKANASATNLKAIDRAAQNLGTQADEAIESVQGLARALRTNPGNEGWLQALGVQTRLANGELRDTTDLIVDLADQLRDKPYFLAEQIAQEFGISEDMLRAMRSTGFRAEVEKMRKDMRNTGFEQASKQAKEFMKRLRGLTTQLEIFGLRVYEALVKKLGGGIDTLTEWLRVNGPLLATRTAEALLSILDLVARITPAIVWLVDKFIEWDEATDGWSTKLLGLLAVMKIFGGFSILRGILSLAGAFVKLGAGIAGAAGSATGLVWLLSRLGLLGAAGAVGYVAGTAIQKNLPESWNDKIGETVAKGMMLFRSKGAHEALATNDPQAYLRMLGWSSEQTAGIIANLMAESRMNPAATGDNGRAYGLAQWHPDRQAMFQRRFGKPIQGSSAAEQLQFLDYELRYGNERGAGALLLAAQNSRQAAQIMARYYERPRDIEGEARRRGEIAVQLSQKTDIHVHGGNAADTGREIARAQDRVNARLARNFAPVTK